MAYKYFAIWNPKNIEAAPEDTVFVRLIDAGSIRGRVKLIACTASGTQIPAGNLCTLTENGMKMHTSVSSLLPFDLTHDRRIRTRGEG